MNSRQARRTLLPTLAILAASIVVAAPAASGQSLAAADQYSPGGGGQNPGGGGGQNPGGGGGENPGGGGGENPANGGGAENPADGGGAENPAAGGGGAPTGESSAGELPFTGYPMTALLWVLLAIVLIAGVLRVASGIDTHRTANAPRAG